MFSLAGIAGLVALIPGGGAVAGFAVNALSYLIRCKPCLYAFGTAALCGWVALHVHRADVASCDGRLEDQRQAAARAAVARDIEVQRDLEKTFAPGMSAMRALNQSLQDKVNEYAKRPPPAAAPGKAAPGCKLGDAAGLLRKPAAR